MVKTGNSLNDDHELPDWMNTQEMRQAMSTLRQFSEKDKDYFAYQARQNYLRQQMSVYGELDAVKLREQQDLAREQAALEREQAAQAEVERLKALLAQSNPTSNDQTITLKRK